jgi:hypothetical protein
VCDRQASFCCCVFCALWVAWVRQVRQAWNDGEVGTKKYGMQRMTDSPLEPLDLLDTDYADILANSSDPSFELQLVWFKVDAASARMKTNFITSRAPKTWDSRTRGYFNRSMVRSLRVWAHRWRFSLIGRNPVGESRQRWSWLAADNFQLNLLNRAIALFWKDELLPLCLNQRGIPTIGQTLRYQSRKTRGGAVLSAINNASDPANKVA